MAYKPAEAKAVSTSFQAFLWTNISKIEQYEDEGDYPAALNKACRLVKYLPTSVKEKMEENVNQITTFMNEIFQANSNNFYTTMTSRNRQVASKASFYLKQFMNKLMMLLDQRGIYMEYKRKSTPTNIPAEFFEQEPPEVQEPSH